MDDAEILAALEAIDGDRAYRRLADPYYIDRDPLDWTESAFHDVDECDGHAASYTRLVRVLARVTELGRALARGHERLADGRNVRDQIDHMYRTAEGYTEDTLARRELIGAVATAAATCDASDDDASLCRAVCYDPRIPLDVAELLEAEPAKVALAVRMWMRGSRRPRKDEPKGSKWAAVADVARLAGLPVTDAMSNEDAWKLDDRITEQPLDTE